MKAVSIKELKSELQHCSHPELLELCLQLSKFKKENKELLTYVLFESTDEDGYIARIKSEMEELFEQINTNSYFYIKKSVRKILKMAKTSIRYSKKKETEIEILLHFCLKLSNIKPSIKNSTVLKNLFIREKTALSKKISILHEDLQYDYGQMLKELTL